MKKIAMIILGLGVLVGVTSMAPEPMPKKKKSVESVVNWMTFEQAVEKSKTALFLLMFIPTGADGVK